MKDRIILNIYKNIELEKTLDEIERLANDYTEDTINFAKLSLQNIFDFISKKIKYIPDPTGYEFLMRPKRLLQKKGGDCDDKCVFAMSIFKNMIEQGKSFGYGYSIVCQKGRKNFHHIFPFLIINGQIKDFDATYAKNKMFVSKNWIKRKNFVMKDEK